MITFLILVHLQLQANTMFMLTHIPKAYIVVENYSQKISKNIKEEIYDELQNDNIHIVFENEKTTYSKIFTFDSTFLKFSKSV